jgi:hypothetical protein
MDRVLDGLLGQSVSWADSVHDYVQLRFGNGDLLNVYNKFLVDGLGNPGLADLVGCVVEGVLADEGQVVLAFGAVSLRVSLLEASYQGPEAIEYIPLTGDRVVWS